MNQFSRWSCIVHPLLSKHLPKIKLGQVHQLLAACLGHQSYASLRIADLKILNQKPRYVLFDSEAGFARAMSLGLLVTDAQWQEVTMSLRPSGITPFWLTSMRGMHNAARLTFEDTFDTQIHTLKRAFGFPDGQLARSSLCHSTEDDLSDMLRFDVEGEVHAYNEEKSLSIPVIAVVQFPKIGRRMYGDGALVSVKQDGEPNTRDTDDDECGDVYWMSED